jgi:hypothetical protein
MPLVSCAWRFLKDHLPEDGAHVSHVLLHHLTDLQQQQQQQAAKMSNQGRQRDASQRMACCIVSQI